MIKINTKKLLFVLTTFIIFLSTSTTVYAPAMDKEQKLDAQIEFLKIDYDSATLQLIEAVENYINEYSKGSLIDVELIIRLSDIYDVDLLLILAQGHLESHFGTRGLASMTNSVFNVGTYDNGTILYQYSHPNYSIEPYIQLLKSRYLTQKSTKDLLNDEFVNINGKRYASNKRYEKDLLKIIDNIERKTSIDSLQHIRKIRAMFKDKTDFEYIFEFQNNNKLLKSETLLAKL